MAAAIDKPQIYQRFLILKFILRKKIKIIVMGNQKEIKALI